MLAIIILAAGGGTRMKSRLPKVLHCIAGKPLIHHVLETAKKLTPDKLVVVLGHEKNQVEPYVADIVHEVACQDNQLGTAHAVNQALPLLKGFSGDAVILYGDTPLIKEETISRLIKHRQQKDCSVVLATMNIDNPTGYGRVIRNGSGDVLKIVEEKDATEKERQITEVNTGIYCFSYNTLLENIDKVSNNNEQNEYYLTDVISLLVSSGKKVTAEIIDSNQALGVNSRKDLSIVSKIIRKEINEKLMASGVTLEDPATAYVEESVIIGSDTKVGPNVTIEGKTVIEGNCIIGANTHIKDSLVKEGAKITNSYITEAEIGKNAAIGPFSHLRPGTVVKEDVKVGAYSEIKKSTIGKNSKVPHLSYIGDSDIGENVNVGAGTVTCNYDGKHKHKTEIKDDAFIGSDTMLIAPIKVGKGSYTGAGSVLTEDVPDDSLALERSKQKNIKGWAKKKG